MALFHINAYGLPPLKIGTLNGVVLSYHAQTRALEKGIKVKMADLATFVPSNWQLIELEVVNGVPIKIVARQPFDEIEDLVIVILRKERLIKTIWFNRRDDTHLTLDKSPYSKP